MVLHINLDMKTIIILTLMLAGIAFAQEPKPVTSVTLTKESSQAIEILNLKIEKKNTEKTAATNQISLRANTQMEDIRNAAQAQITQVAESFEKDMKPLHDELNKLTDKLCVDSFGQDAKCHLDGDKLMKDAPAKQ